MTAQWDTGWLIWIIILSVLAGLCWLSAAGGLVAGFLTKGKAGVGWLLGSVAAALFIGVIGTWVAFPFSGQYHRYVLKSGVVTKIGFRFLASDTQGGGTTQKYVVTFAGGQSYGCLDTRCANVTVGDRLTLLCKRSWQFNVSYPGWDCNWGIDRKPNGQMIP